MKYFILTLYILLSFAANAQTYDWTQQAGPLGGSILDMEYDAPSGKIFVVAGGYNKPYVSTNNGATWSKITLPGNSNGSIQDIEITNSTIFLLSDYILYASVDGGVTFTERTANSSQFSSGNRIKRLPSSGNLVLISYNQIYKSSNNGINWSPGFLNSSGSLNNSYLAVNLSDQIFIIKDNKPYKSTDGGNNFSLTSTGIPAGEMVQSLTSDNSGNLYCVTGPNLYKCTDGINWFSIKGTAPSSISDATVSGGVSSIIKFSADGLGMYFIDNFNYKIHSKTVTGAAISWTLRTSTFSVGIPIQSVLIKDFPGSSAATSTAFFGTISSVFKTTTGGASIIESVTGLTEMGANQIIVDDFNNLFISTGSNGVLKSSDAGNNWSNTATIAGYINSLAVNPAGDAIYVHTNSFLYKSIDKGLTWPILTTTVPFIWFGTAADNDKVFGLPSSSSTTLYYSANRGGLWAPATSISGLPGGLGFSISTNTISFASATLMLMRVYDYNSSTYDYYKVTIAYPGSTATAVATKLTSLPFTNISDATAANGKFYLYSSSSTDQISVSSNGGSSWTTVTVPNSSDMFVTENGYIFLTDNGNHKIYISRDDGASFITTTTGSTLELYNLNDIAINPSSGFAYLGLSNDYVYSSAKNIVTPAAPSGLTNAGISSTAISLKWTDNSNNDDHFLIERSTNGIDFTKAGEVEDNDVCTTPGAIGFFVDNGLTPSTSYTYRVSSVNDAGSSTYATAAPIATVASCAQNLPDNRSWSAINSGESGFPFVTPKTVGIKHLGSGLYQISDAAITTLGASAIPATFFINCGTTLLASSNNNKLKSNGTGTWNSVAAELTLKWRACAVDEYETITLTLNPNDPAPVAPNMRALVINDTQVEVTWDAGFYNKTYVVERSLSSSSGFAQINATPPTIYPITKFIDSGLSEGTTYYYRVKVRNGNTSPLESPYSTVNTVTFKKPNFTVAPTTMSSYYAPTIGAYWADLDNDGLEDYMTVAYNTLTEEGRPTIFKNLGNGDFIQSFMTVDNPKSIFGSVVDYNNDGKQDIALLVDESNQLDIYKGNGDLTFNKVAVGTLGDLSTTIASGDEISYMSWGDINNDGLIDLLLVVTPNSGGNKLYLYKQNSTHAFTKVTGGDLATDTDESSSLMWADYNNDGFQDVLISNSETSQPVRLYRNNGNDTFTKATGTGIDAVSAFTVAWGDYNNDGNIDFFSSNATQNALYKNNGDGTFTKDVSTSISEATYVLGAAWADYNNDGFLDLITSSFFGYPTRLFIRDAASPGSIIFTKIVTEKLTDPAIAHYGIAVADYNKNGFLDVAMSNLVQDVSTDEISATYNNLFLNNNFANGKNWLEVKLTPANGNAAAIGAKIRVTTGATTQVRQIESASSLASHSSSIAHFGLGASTTADNVQIIWPSGIIQNLGSKASNQIIVVPEDGAGPVAASYTPSIGSTVGSAVSVSIEFNEATTAVASKKLNIYLSTNLASSVKSLDVTTGTKVGNKYTFVISPKLATNSSYVVTIDAGAFKDLYGNNYAGLVASNWSFQTSEAPVVSSLLPAINATSIAVTTALEITFSEDVTAVAGKKIKVMDGTTAVVDLDVSTNGTVAANKYTLPAPTAKWPNNKTLQVIIDPGAFVDTDQNDFAGITSGNWTLTTAEAPDAIAPSITFDAATLATLQKNFSPVTVSVTISDNKAVASAIMHHRKITEKTYTPTNLALNNATGKWEGQVSNTFADEAGFEYYFTAVDAAANQGRSPVGDGTNKTYLIYMSADTKIPSDRLGFGGKKANWKVAAIPFELASNNSVTTIFDELTSTALLNKIDYRLITYKDNTKWAEYPSDFSTITRGKGYFINIKNPIDIAVGNNLTVPPNSRGSLFEMTLQQGWNMIGNPYLTPISWSDVATLNNLTGTTADLKKFTSGQYASGATLQPFEGGFVFASSAVTISIPFTGQTTPGGRRAFEDLGTDINADQWGVNLTLNQGDFKYELSSVGMAPDANISFDNYDDVTPPRFFDYLEVNFSHPEYFTKYFTRDVVPTMSEYIWNFTVDSNLPGVAKLTWSDLSLTAGSNQLFLLDVGRQKLVNMRESTYYSFVPDQSSRFKLYFGENLRIAPEKVSLGKAYPNPTSGYTTFTFSLPESGGLQQDVTLDVLDALGRPVTTLTQGKFTPGYHEVSWLAKDIANGLYSYRLTALGLAGRTVQFEKLVIK